jgi:hypothetical protein
MRHLIAESAQAAKKLGIHLAESQRLVEAAHPLVQRATARSTYGPPYLNPRTAWRNTTESLAVLINKASILL